MEPIIHILHLEDDIADANLVQAILEDEGLACRVTRVQTGERFTAELRQGKYDLILADYRLPGYNGMSALRLVQEIGIEIPFIFVSGTMGEEAAIEGLREGATDYVLKQKLARLAPAVKRALLEVENRRERQRAERSLAVQFQFLQLLMDTIPSPIFYKDVNGVYLGCNQALAEFLGRPKEEIIGKTVFDTYPQELAEKYYQMDQALFQNPGPQIYESPMVRADGAIRDFIYTKATFIDVSGKVAGLIGVMTDITERKRAEAALIRAKEEWELTFNSVPHLIAILDPQHRIIRINQTMAAKLGIAPEEAVGRKCHELVHKTNFPHQLCPHAQVLADSREHTEEILEENLGGYFLVNASPLRNGQGNLLGSVHIARDITEHKQAQEAKQKLEAQLRQAQKMEAIGTLAGGIAHDFNNILSAIIGYGEMIQMFHQSENPEVRRDVDEILKAAFRAKDLVQQILTFSRRVDQNRKPIPLQMIIKESVKFLRASLPSTIEISQFLDPHVGPVLADPTQMQQVVMNLCTNAAHAMREKGGVLEVGLGQVVVDAGSGEELLKLTPGPYALITVKDTGHGISPVFLERIFDPYFSTKEMGEGTGLGLSVVEGIIQSHGGAVRVESQLNVGTVFHVFIPMVERSETSLPTETPGPIPTGHGRVLFVDDEPALADLGQEVLRNLGYEVEALTSSMAALERFLQHPRKYDLAILDLTMPQITGVELARKLLQSRPNLPIILSSGFADKIHQEDLMEMGIREFISKPWNVHILAETIKKALG
ncbi:MAG: response regulator [Deltaproteobacteria bacterium]|nr:MAG: response regulator [Deltaproteobacteria bacterium]